MHIVLNDMRTQITGNVAITVMIDEARAMGHDVKVLEVEELSDGIKLTLARWLIRGVFGIVVRYKGRRFIMSSALKGSRAAIAAVELDGHVMPVHSQLSVELAHILLPQERKSSKLEMLLDPGQATRTLDVSMNELN